METLEGFCSRLVESAKVGPMVSSLQASKLFTLRSRVSKHVHYRNYRMAQQYDNKL
jgi:hypothetical protein